MKRRPRELFLDTSSSGSCGGSGERKQLTRADYDAFDAAVAPVEAASGGVRLAGRCRGACIAAWRDHRPGFLQCVHDALDAAVESPLRLLCAKVFARDHELGPAAVSAARDNPATGGKTDDRYSRFDI